MSTTVTMKRCGTCRAEKATTDFYKATSSQEGLRPRCKACINAAGAKYLDRTDRICGAAGCLVLAYMRGNYCKPHAAANSATWQRNNLDKLAAYQSELRARRKGLFVEYVDRRIAYDLSDGVCHLCFEHCDYDDFHLDHILPESLGGEYSYENLAPSHPKCNMEKGATPNWMASSVDVAFETWLVEAEYEAMYDDARKAAVA